MSEALLQIDGLKVRYGAIEAVKSLDLRIAEGERVTLIGANGAGKTSSRKALTGLLPAARGQIHFAGCPVLGLAPHELLRQGIAMVPEGRGIFARMTVHEHLLMGAQVVKMRNYDRLRDQVFHLFPRLKERLTQRGGTLSGGEQQMLAIGRALMSQPRLLLLDEPSLGLAPLVVRQIFGAIRDLNATEGLTVLLVEQNAYQALRLAHRGYVLVNGAITMTGPGAELLARPEIRAAYLEGAH